MTHTKHILRPICLISDTLFLGDVHASQSEDVEVTLSKVFSKTDILSIAGLEKSDPCSY